jgi:hypothetical protein
MDRWIASAEEEKSRLTFTRDLPEYTNITIRLDEIARFREEASTIVQAGLTPDPLRTGP